MSGTPAGHAYGRPDDEQDPRGEHEHGPTVRDKRRIDPVTGEVRHSAESASAGSAGSASSPAPSPSDDQAAEIVGLQSEVAERTADLQRVQAEYTNYRRRVDRDRDAVRQLAVAGLLTSLLPVLDDIGRARDHGELTGAFKAVADSLDSAVTKAGLVTFGEVGDAFDPNRHEALMHAYSDEVTQTTCTQVFQPGYQLGDRVLRPARVAVADPTEALPAQDVEAAIGDEPVAAAMGDQPADDQPVDDGSSDDQPRDDPPRDEQPGTPFGV